MDHQPTNNQTNPFNTLPLMTNYPPTNNNQIPNYPQQTHLTPQMQHNQPQEMTNFQQDNHSTTNSSTQTMHPTFPPTIPQIPQITTSITTQGSNNQEMTQDPVNLTNRQTTSRPPTPLSLSATLTFNSTLPTP